MQWSETGTTLRCFILILLVVSDVLIQILGQDFTGKISCDFFQYVSEVCKVSKTDDRKRCRFRDIYAEIGLLSRSMGATRNPLKIACLWSTLGNAS